MSWRFVTLAALFVACLLTANTMASKLIVLGGVVLSAAIVIFPLSYVLGDVLTEVWGYGAARRVIWLGFACNALMVAALWLGGALPPAPFWKGQAAYEDVLGATPRILLASFLGYLAGEFANAYVLARLKILTRGRWLWTRTIGSTLVGQSVDSFIFYPLAFYGIWTPGKMMQVVFFNFVFKVCVEVVFTPLTYAVVGLLKRLENEDYFDRGTQFTPFSLAD